MDIRFLLAFVLGLGGALALGLSLAPISNAAVTPTDPGGFGQTQIPGTEVTQPVGQVSSTEAIDAATRDPVAIDQAAKNPGLEQRARLVDGRWEVGLYAGEERVGLVMVDAESGAVTESWSGEQVAWKMARGYSGAFGRKLNAPYVFIPLCLIFLVGLIDWRRPWRLANLDLVLLLGFAISHIYFNRAEIGVSVPLAYPVLLYLLARMLAIGFRGPGRGAGIRPTWPTAWLIIALFFLVGFRVGLNVVDAGVADIGYASVVGADRILSGEEVYGNFPDDVSEGDTYGPFTYYAYAPFVAALPWSGEWDSLPAAHAAAIAFDLGSLALLYLLGCRIRPGPQGRRLGVILAFGWAAYPYTAFALMANSNDSLLALLLLAALALSARPVARGAVAALAVLAKFAPLVALPILARHGRSSLPRFGLGFLVVSVLVMAQTVLGPGLKVFYDRTLGYQAGRDSPFSIWGQVPELEPLRIAILAAVTILGLITLRWPRRPTTTQVAALVAALVIGTQLVATHWFYLYLVWFFPLVLIAFAAGQPSFSGAFRGVRPASSPARTSSPSHLRDSRSGPP